VPSIEVVPPVKVVLTPVEVQTFDVTVSAPNPVVQVVSEGPQGPSGGATGVVAADAPITYDSGRRRSGLTGPGMSRRLTGRRGPRR
jgi:hypothetical protein